MVSIFKGISVTSTETIVPPKSVDKSPTPGGDILEDVVDSSTR
jgi:hypothetical protein